MAQQAKYRAKNTEKIRASQKVWREENRELKARMDAEYAKRRPEVRRRARDAWTERNAHRLDGIYRRHYEANREKIIARSKAWKAAHPESVRACTQRRRALKKNATVAEKFKDGEIFERDRWVCQICGKKVDPKLKRPSKMCASLDHVIPLSQGGAHSRLNVQLAHLSCNSQKHAVALTLF